MIKYILVFGAVLNISLICTNSWGQTGQSNLPYYLTPNTDPNPGQSNLPYFLTPNSDPNVVPDDGSGSPAPVANIPSAPCDYRCQNEAMNSVSPSSAPAAGSLSGAQNCQALATSATVTCTSPQGIGGQSAAAIQNIANQAAIQQEQAATAQTGGVTVVNVTNGQQQNPGANAACNATKLMADANLLTSVVASSFCITAHAACIQACQPGDTSSPLLKSIGKGKVAQCEAALKTFEGQVIPQALNGAMMAAGGAACNNALAANVNPPQLAGAPGMPPTDQPGNIGYQGNPPGSPAPMAAADTSGAGGGSNLPTSGYPAGPTDKGTQAAGGATQRSYELSLSNGGGGGAVPFANNGTGNMPGKASLGFDLASLLGNGKEGANNRSPAGLTEVTGPNDLTNFQKVTRMMNKKRTTLKSGDGA